MKSSLGMAARLADHRNTRNNLFFGVVLELPNRLLKHFQFLLQYLRVQNEVFSCNFIAFLFEGSCFFLQCRYSLIVTKDHNFISLQDAFDFSFGFLYFSVYLVHMLNKFIQVIDILFVDGVEISDNFPFFVGEGIP